MEVSKGKGTVTSLSSLFSAEEVEKAAKHIEDSIAKKKNELDRIFGFVNENNNVINLVQKLPEQLSHDIMVPFGKAACFPGRLVHTNEFLIHLGEGYYAERTSKQTVEILQRRGKILDSQVDSFNVNIKDLEAEVSYFNSTASQVAEGLVEIREDYVEGVSEEGESKSDSKEVESKSGPLKPDTSNLGDATTDNEEYARMVSIMDELEKEELAEESGHCSDQNEETTDFDDVSCQRPINEELACMVSRLNESEEELAVERGNHSDLNEKTTADFNDISYQRPIDDNLQSSEDFHQGIALDQTTNKIIATKFPKTHNHQEDISADQLNFASLAVQSKVGEGKNFAQNVESVDPSAKFPIIPKEKMTQATTTSKIEARLQTSQPSFDRRKAFTGSIIEHAENLQTTSREQSSTSSQVSGSQTSKPVSRFKMQRWLQ